VSTVSADGRLTRDTEQAETIAPGRGRSRDRDRRLPSPVSPAVLISPSAFVTGYSLARRLQIQPRAGRLPEPLDAVDRLALTMSDLCRGAVDSLAIAAGLEAEGLSDRAAAEQYGHGDLFELADELHRRVPRDVDLRPPPEPAPTDTTRALLRGVLFIAPALCGVTFLITAVTGPARAALATIQVLAWGYGQGIAHLAYTRLGTGDIDGARRLLRAGTRNALLATASLVSATGLLFGPPTRALVPALATLCFCVAAIPELVLGAEYELAVTLTPAVLGALADWLNAPAETGLIGLALAATAAVALAGRTTAPAARGRTRTDREPDKSGAPGRMSPGRMSLRRFSLVQVSLRRISLHRISRRLISRRLISLCRISPCRISRRLISRCRISLGRTSLHRISLRSFSLRRFTPGRISLRRVTGLQKADLTEAAPHFASGLGTGTLLTLVLAGPAASRGPAALHAALVLTVAMGAGEWHARWYQRRVERVLTDIGYPGEFPWRATRVMLVALARQAGTTAALAAAGYIAFDRSDPGAVGYYLFAVALAPGLLAALFLRSVDARDAFWPTMAALGATLAAVPSRDMASLAALALETTVLLAIRAIAATARPWVHL
jgi:hypothetical protein